MEAQEVVEALLSAFDRAKLVEFMRFKMGRTLDDIATGDSLDEIVFKLVDHYERKGEIWKLIATAALANPNNEQLAALVTRGPVRTQARRVEREGAHRMDDWSRYYSGEEFQVLSTIVTKLSEQMQVLSTTFARWEEAAKHAAETNNNRVKAIEKEMELLRTRQDQHEQQLTLLRVAAGVPNQMPFSPRMMWAMFAIMLIIAIMVGVVVYQGYGG